jgi:predicted dehydrogenase
MNSIQLSSDVSRRHFLKKSSLVVAGAAVAPYVLTSHAQADDPPIKVGLIGCGGRGSGAVRDACKSAKNVQIVAVADVFDDRAKAAREAFNKEGHNIPAEMCFSGFDAYKQVLAIPEINYVILAAPPGFRPVHFPAAIEAGKHVFMEKPVAVDSSGVRTMLKAGELATQKKLCVVAGTQRRHHKSYIETIKRIHDGAIGEIVYLRCYWDQGEIWNYPWREGLSDMENQLRNWYHYTWLSGDHIVEQHMHNIDVCNWVMQDHPIKAYGRGGRQWLKGRGQIYDHFGVEFEYKNGIRMYSHCRQIPNCTNNINEAVIGTKGISNPNSSINVKGGPPWRFSDKYPNPYVQEHADLIAAIRSGQYLNETKQVVEGTLTAIMGRESAYSGQQIDWDTALESEISRAPAKYEFGPTPPVEAPVPGVYKFE